MEPIDYENANMVANCSSTIFISMYTYILLLVRTPNAIYNVLIDPLVIYGMKEFLWLLCFTDVWYSCVDWVTN